MESCYPQLKKLWRSAVMAKKAQKNIPISPDSPNGQVDKKILNSKKEK